MGNLVFDENTGLEDAMEEYYAVERDLAKRCAHSGEDLFNIYTFFERISKPTKHGLTPEQRKHEDEMRNITLTMVAQLKEAEEALADVFCLVSSGLDAVDFVKARNEKYLKPKNSN